MERVFLLSSIEQRMDSLHVLIAAASIASKKFGKSAEMR